MGYDPSHFYIDFSKSILLTDAEKKAIEQIQQTFLPMERAELLNEYRIQGKITDDEYEIMTGIPYRYGM